MTVKNINKKIIIIVIKKIIIKIFTILK